MLAPLDPRCKLSLDQGPCRDYIIQWYYDKQANACAQFWFGGCDGNANRYETEEECKRTCVLSRTGESHFCVPSEKSRFCERLVRLNYLLYLHSWLKTEEKTTNSLI